MKDNKVHLSSLIDKFAAVYFFDDLEEVYYQNEIDESLGNNSAPVNTIISRQDVKSILEKIRECKAAFVEARPKNDHFLVKYNLDENDCRAILAQLTVSDYTKSTTSINSKHTGNNLVIFEPSSLIVDGNVIEGVIVSIKIDMDETTETSIAVVSFYEINSRDNFPYR